MGTKRTGARSLIGTCETHLLWWPFRTGPQPEKNLLGAELKWRRIEILEVKERRSSKNRASSRVRKSQEEAALFLNSLWKELKREVCDIRKATLKPPKVQKSKFHIKMSNSEALESNSMQNYKSKESKEQNSIPTNSESSLPWECFLLKRSKLQPLTNNKKVTWDERRT